MDDGPIDTVLGAHLAPNARQMLERSAKERVDYVKKDAWIPYRAATAILNQLEDLLTHPKVARMPFLAICSRTNNGKTRLLDFFLEQHQADDNVAGEAADVPVLRIQCPGVPDEARLYDEVFRRVFVRVRPSMSVRDKQTVVFGTLADIRVRMLIVDEVNFAESGTVAKQKSFLNALRALSIEQKIPIVMAGTEEMMRVIRTIPAFENRAIPAYLPIWQCDLEFQQLLASFETIIPLRHPSMLSKKKFAILLHSRCEGTIGELKLLLGKLAEWAIASGEERITEAMVDLCGYKSPSIRRRERVPV
jgi:hypothetical protein